MIKLKILGAVLMLFVVHMMYGLSVAAYGIATTVTVMFLALLSAVLLTLDRE